MTALMRQARRQVTDREILSAMLDRMEVIHLGMHDGAYPYVVPLNFGYEWREDELIFYFHCARKGRKLELLARDPHVCVTASAFVNYAQDTVKGHLHDYRSIIARGVASPIDPREQAEEAAQAMRRILIHHHRDTSCAETPLMGSLLLWRIVCKAEEVTGKAEITPRCLADVPFAAPAHDGIPLDESHILDAGRED
ncbi:MAG: pyridoxamine 5'-phosphate oxidase family protein [Clostridia bacterium]|nr:pyridoxamine 5'-phosphate oxidase family protein [Clostridia bacterium]